MRPRAILGVSVITVLLAGTCAVIAGTILGVVNFRDVGYPDSADLLRVGELVQTGLLYPDFNHPPYLVTQYGPLTYLFLAVPFAVARSAGLSSLVFVRLAEVSAWTACLSLIFLISRRLGESRRLASVCVLFAASSLVFAAWTTQLRGDLPAAALSLAAVFLFFSSKRWPRIASAVVCGMAILTKQTFWAAPAAILVCLIWRHRFKAAVVWGGILALTVACGFAIAFWREPLGWKHLAELRYPILDFRGALPILWTAVSQPVVPFALLGVFAAAGISGVQKPAPARLLLVTYCLTSWMLAILTVPQVGANINYFWEPLLSSAALAGPGLRQLQRATDRLSVRGGVRGGVVMLLLLSWPLLLVLNHAYKGCLKSYRDASTYSARRAKWESFAKILSGHRLLSNFPDVAVRGTLAEMPDPFLNAILERRSAWSSGPVVAAIEAGAYDLVVVGRGEAGRPRDYRGVRLWSDPVWKAVKQAYRPACAFEEMEAWTRQPESGGMLPALLAIGCAPVNVAGDNNKIGTYGDLH